jgi:hypothetical protein
LGSFFFCAIVVREWDLAVPDPTLDERFIELRQSVDLEIARARREVIAAVAGAVSQMRSASNESEWSTAVTESEQRFEGDSEALELVAALAALTAPASNDSPPAQEARAQRFAKVRIAEIQLYQAPAVKAGRASRDLYGALKPHIDAARQAFEERFLSNGTRTADYLHFEFVRALANDDATLLGPGYPGPLA